MKLPVRILMVLLCIALIAAIPFVVSSPNMLYDVKMELMNEEDEGDDEIDFGRLFFSTAFAEEELEVEELEDGQFASHPEWKLPFDFSAGQEPKADLYTDNSYEDESIRVRFETRDFDEGTRIFIAYVQIADASQLRTGVYKPDKLASSQAKPIMSISNKYHPVVAINGDNYTNDPKKTTFEYRMGEMIRSSGNMKKDILIIDDQGDFHLYIKSEGLSLGKNKKGKNVWMKAEDWEKENGRKLVNAFTFGPALVKDGELVEYDEGYGYNPGGREPRTAIGQMGKLSYVLVVVQAEDRSGSSGMSQRKLAEFMYELGCKQAFNLDGGNTAGMVFGDKEYKGMLNGGDRDITDIIYFASSQP